MVFVPSLPPFIPTSRSFFNLFKLLCRSNLSFCPPYQGPLFVFSLFIMGPSYLCSFIFLSCTPISFIIYLTRESLERWSKAGRESLSFYLLSFISHVNLESGDQRQAESLLQFRRLAALNQALANRGIHRFFRGFDLFPTWCDSESWGHFSKDLFKAKHGGMKVHLLFEMLNIKLRLLSSRFLSKKYTVGSNPWKLHKQCKIGIAKY